MSALRNINEEPQVRMTLRLPKKLHGRLVGIAQSSRRSLHSEILHRLEHSLQTPPEDIGKAR